MSTPVRCNLASSRPLPEPAANCGPGRAIWWLALGLAMVIIVFFYQPVKVEGTSMAPLHLGSGAHLHQ